MLYYRCRRNYLWLQPLFPMVTGAVVSAFGVLYHRYRHLRLRNANLCASRDRATHDLQLLAHQVRSMVKVAPLAVPQLGSCTSSGRAWRLCAARHSQGEARPVGSQPRPQLLERAAFEVACLTACVLSPTRCRCKVGCRHRMTPAACPPRELPPPR